MIACCLDDQESADSNEQQWKVAAQHVDIGRRACTRLAVSERASENYGTDAEIHHAPSKRERLRESAREEMKVDGEDAEGRLQRDCSTQLRQRRQLLIGICSFYLGSIWTQIKRDWYQ